MLSSARRSLGRGGPKQNMFRGGEAPVLCTKVENVGVPPALNAAIRRRRPVKQRSATVVTSDGEDSEDEDEEGMDASFFVASWDMLGREVHELLDGGELLPRDFDVYVVGLQNCGSLPAAREACADRLAGMGDYVDFSHLMSESGGALKTSLGLLVFARRSLVDREALSMSRVDTVRERRPSFVQPVLQDRSLLELSTPRDHKSIRDFGANGGAVSIRFNFFDTNVLFAVVKESSIEELNGILASVRPEDHAHVFLLGDFGDDVVDKTEELAQRLFLEEFDKIPPRFRNARRMVLTRSQDRALHRYLVPDVHGHYHIWPSMAASSKAKKAKADEGAGRGDPAEEGGQPGAAAVSAAPAACFSTYRLHGGAAIDRRTLPPPPKAPPAAAMDEEPSTDYYDGGDNDSVFDIPPPPHMEEVMPGPPPPTGAESGPSQVAVAAAQEEQKASDDGGLMHTGSTLLRRAIRSLRLVTGREAAPVSYGECSVCAEPILDQADHFRSMDKSYHRNCVRCADCDKMITSQFFVVNGEMLCQESYQKLFVKSCAACGERADPQDHLIKTAQQVFHVDCFKCATCDEALACVSPDGTGLEADDFILGDDGAVFCATHGSKHTCAGCLQPAAAKDAVQVGMGPVDPVVFHRDCFRCDTCDKTIAELGGEYVLYEEKFFCTEDYKKARDAADKRRSSKRRSSKRNSAKRSSAKRNSAKRISSKRDESKRDSRSEADPSDVAGSEAQL